MGQCEVCVGECEVWGSVRCVGECEVWGGQCEVCGGV